MSLAALADEAVAEPTFESLFESAPDESRAPAANSWQKRALDLVGALLAILVLMPLLVVVALAVKLADRGPVFYRQRRVGYRGQDFEILKFRSMSPGADRLLVDLTDHNVTDGLLFKVVADPRVTPVGRVIRRLSLDELPQLWNVVRGDMSLVGPRPLAVSAEDFSPIEHRRHAVRPGITGWWQIAGGNRLGYSQMISLDLLYVRDWSLGLDLRLLVRTIPALFDRGHIA